MRYKISKSKSRTQVYFKKNKILLDTVRSYASDPESLHHQDAKKFLKNRKEKKTEFYNNKEWFTDRIMENYDETVDHAWKDWRSMSLGGGAAAFFKKIPRDISAKIDNPSTSFKKGFDLFANPKPESKEKIKKEMGQFFKKVFKGDLKKGEEEKMADCLMESKSKAMDHLAEASKEIGKEIGRYGISTMMGLMGAALSVSGKAIAGGIYSVVAVMEVMPNAMDTKKLDKYWPAVSRINREKALEFKKAKEEATSQDIMGQVFGKLYGVPSKDEVSALSLFVKDGVFDQKAYEKEMAKALSEVKENANKIVKKLNKDIEEEKTSKKATRLVKRYLLKKANDKYRLY